MKKSYITGKNHDFYSRGKAMFDQIQPITQGTPQIPQEHSSNRQWVGLTGWEREAIALECAAQGCGGQHISADGQEAVDYELRCSK